MLAGISMLFAIVLVILLAVNKWTRGRDADGRRTRGVVTRWALDSVGIETRQPARTPDNSWSDYLGR